MKSLLLAAGLISVTTCLFAATATHRTFQVTASVAAQCHASAGHREIGAISPSGGNVDEMTVSVQCTNSLPFDVDLRAGNSISTMATWRLVARKGHTLQYMRYVDAGHPVVSANARLRPEWMAVADFRQGTAPLHLQYRRRPLGQSNAVTHAVYAESDVVVTVTY